MRIVFAGTPDFAVPALRALLASGHQLLAVYTQPDRPAGRGRKLTASPVKQVALELGIPVEQPPGLHSPEVQKTLAQYAPEAMVVAAYGLILPPEVLDIPTYGCLNIHASLLPRWRGAAPIQRAILAGDEYTGVSIMLMDAGLDTGPVYLRQSTRIEPHDTAGSLHERLAAMGAEAILEVLAAIAAGRAQAQPQEDALATYAHKIDKQEAWIDWGRPADEIGRKVRAFNPYPVARTRWRERQLRIWEAWPVTTEVSATTPGKILRADAGGIVVACGVDALSIQTLQLPGGRPISAADFVNSNELRDAVFT